MPDDGFVYTSFTSSQCGGLCKCWVSGSLQMTLLPFAIGAFLLYSIGFVVLLFYILEKNKVAIRHDQVIRAYETIKPTFKWNIRPSVLQVRTRYSRLYFRFHPDFYWWSLVVLARKLLICFTALFYTENPTLQFSLTLLIMFASFVLQIRIHPYVSEKNHGELLKEHITRYTNYRRSTLSPPDSPELDEIEVHPLGKIHSEIEANIQNDLSFSKHKAITKLEDMHKIKKNELFLELASNRLISYNTVDATLLCCAVLVCLTGIMFQAVPADSSYQTERKTLTYFCITLISSSIFYIFVVMFNEINVKVQCCKSKKHPKPISEESRLSNDINDLTESAVATGVKVKRNNTSPVSKGGNAKPKSVQLIQQSIKVTTELNYMDKNEDTHLFYQCS